MSQHPEEDLEAGLGLDERTAERFRAYLSLLLKWNARMNLTAVRAAEQIVRRHFAESIFAARQVPEDVRTLLDFGSGAGFPGIPIALCRPEIAVTLAEARSRKAAFLRECGRALNLRVEVWAGRVEAMPAERIFDAVTLRAVERMAEACRSAAGRLAPGGWLGAFATHRTESELEALEGIGWNQQLAVPGSAQEILKIGTRV